MEEDIQSFLVENRTRVAPKADFKYLPYNQIDTTEEVQRVEPQITYIDPPTETPTPSLPILFTTAPLNSNLNSELETTPENLLEEAQAEKPKIEDHSLPELNLPSTDKTLLQLPIKLPSVSSGLSQIEEEETSVDVPS